MMGQEEYTEPDRVFRTHEEARKSYDRLSSWYDLLSGGSEWRFDEEALRLLDPGPGESILDVGFGTGKALEWIRERIGTSGRAVGVDLSPGMRSVADRRMVKRGFNDVELVEANALDLPFAEETFDGIFMGFTLELFDVPELPAVTAEVRRVLRPSGRFAVAALALRRTSSRPVRIYRWAHRRFPQLVDCRPIPVGEILTSSGFMIEKLDEALMWGLPVDLLLASKAQRGGS